MIFFRSRWAVIVVLLALRRLVAVELKLGEFQAADKGQMELYLRWLHKHERVSGETSPLGLILSAGKSEELVELLEVKRSGIRVAQYLTELPPQEVLRERLHRLVQTARERQAAPRVLDASLTGSEGGSDQPQE